MADITLLSICLYWDFTAKQWTTEEDWSYHGGTTNAREWFLYPAGFTYSGQKDTFNFQQMLTLNPSQDSILTLDSIQSFDLYDDTSGKWRHFNKGSGSINVKGGSVQFQKNGGGTLITDTRTRHPFIEMDGVMYPFGVSHNFQMLAGRS